MYRSAVSNQCSRNPCLKTLCEFLAEPTSRRIPSRIRSIDFAADAVSNNEDRVKVRTVSDLSAEIAQIASHGVDEKVCGQILMVEDISPSAMEILGDYLEIDPLFFASYLHRTWRKSSTQSPLNCTLPSRERQQDFIPLYSQRSLTFPGLDGQNNQMVQIGNQTRKVLVLPSTKDIRIGLAQHHCSVLIKQRGQSPWIGLYLVDLPVGTEFKCVRNKVLVPVTAASNPYMGGIEDFSPFNPVGNASPKVVPQGMLERLQYYWCSEAAPTLDRMGPSLQSLAYIPLKVMAAEWINYIAVMASSLKSYEASAKTMLDLFEQLE